MKKVRWGVIGCGGIARTRTIPGMLLAENAQLVSVMARNLASAQAVQEQFGAERAYDSAEQLLKNDDLDAVYIATPVFTHSELTRLAADHGKHVLCEKPLGLNADDALRTVEYCREKGVLLSVDLMMRHGAHINRIREAVAAGEIGQVVSADARFSCWMPNACWLTDPARAGGGPLMDTGIHLIDLLRYVTGQEVTAVTAMNERISFPPEGYGVEDSSTVLMRMTNGAQCTVFTNFNIPDSAGKWTVNLFGTRGRLLGDKIIGQLDEGTLWEMALREGEDDFYAEPVAGNTVGTELSAQFGNLYTRTLSDFGEAILHGGTAFIDPMECVRDQRIIDAAYESSRTGRTVFL